MKKHPTLRLLCAATFTFVCFFAFGTATFASITVGPTTKEYTEIDGAAPGAVLKGIIVVTNEDDALQLVKLSVVDVYYDEHNIPVVIEGANKGPNKASLASWIQNLPEEVVTFEPKQKQEIPYEIHIPEDATPGGHVAAIYALGITDPRAKEGEALTIRTRVGAGILVDIPGDVVRTGEITSFDVGIGKGDARSSSIEPQWFFSRPPVNFDAAYKNTGNTFYQPKMQLEITNMWGGKAGEFVSTGLRVFPGNTMHFMDEATRGSWLWFGRYQGILHTQDGHGKALSDRSVVFWVIPWHLILLAIIIFIALFWLSKKYAQYRNKKLKKNIESVLKESNKGNREL